MEGERGGGGEQRCEGKRGDDSCTNAELHKQAAGQGAGAAEQEQNRTRLVSCLVSAAHTRTRGVCVMCEKRSKKYTKKSIKKKIK